MENPVNASDHSLAKRISFAQGYLDLGLFEDAWNELEKLPPEGRTLEPVLLLRTQIYVAAKKWEEAILVGRGCCERFPNQPLFFFWTAYSLHELKRTQEAKDCLLAAPAVFREEAIFNFNLGCYECQLGNLEKAGELIKKAIQLDRKYQALALDDPDLAPLWALRT
jgi:tetratricopeptide (TPR) repeat protein